MPPHTSIAAEYASAVAHPVRYLLVGLLAEGPRTVASLASELDATEDTVVAHAKALRDFGVVEEHSGPNGMLTYELLRDPILFDTAWSKLPVESRRTLVATSVMQYCAAASAAVDRGGWDRDDVHITRTTVKVNELRWGSMRRMMDGTLNSLGDLAEQPVPEDGETFHATAMMLLFTHGPAESAGSVPPAAISQAHDGEWSPDTLRALELVEELGELMVEPGTDWQRVGNLAGQVRLIARAAAGAPLAAPTLVDTPRAEPPSAARPAERPSAGATNLSPDQVQRAVLELLIVNHPAPTGIEEMARMVGSGIDARDAVDDLLGLGLAQSAGDLVWATRGAKQLARLFEFEASPS
ncbi:MAG TPA: winged helix-turn-helix domain-containing protein [Solirubrobacteraceae bacterium]|nr:winged helix-turn-helix domain-containing protein [Solirubrobacteraceae bacterium]